MKKETNVNYRLFNNARCQIHQVLKGKVTSSSTVDILGLDIDTF